MKRLRKGSFEDRMQNEAQGTDPEALERFEKRYGMTPLQYALLHNPSAAEAVSKAFPHLAPPKKKRKPPPAGSR